MDYVFVYIQTVIHSGPIASFIILGVDYAWHWFVYISVNEGKKWPETVWELHNNCYKGNIYTLLIFPLFPWFQKKLFLLFVAADNLKQRICQHFLVYVMKVCINLSTVNVMGMHYHSQLQTWVYYWEISLRKLSFSCCYVTKQLLPLYSIK